MEDQTLGIIGAGAWGTALAVQMYKKIQVHLYDIEQNVYNEIKTQRTNQKALPGIQIPKEIKVFNTLDSLRNNSYIMIVVPSSAVKSVVHALAGINIKKDIPIIIASKGIQEGIQEKQLLSQITEKILGNPVVILSGPNLALEVSEGKYTTSVLSCKNIDLAKQLAKKFSTDELFFSYNTAVVHTQIAGCIKNIAAVLSGIQSVIYNSQNTQAWIVTIAFKEIISISQALLFFMHQSSSLSFNEICNPATLGDLVACCYSVKSRNYLFGQQLATMVTSDRKQLIMNYPSLIEGKENASSIQALEQQIGVNDAVLSSTLCKILDDPENLSRYMKEMLFVKDQL